MHSSLRHSGKFLTGMLRTHLSKGAVIVSAPSRNLNLQEYQSKKIMEDHGIVIQNFRVAESIEDASKIAQTFKV